jgi:hypothetical protein
MTQRTKRTILALAFVLWICYTVFFSVVKLSETKTVDKYHLDVVFHFSSYLVMVILGASLLRWFVLIPALGIAGGTELIQRLLPYRSGNWADFGINLAGIALGLSIWLLVRSIRARRLKLPEDAGRSRPTK